MRRSRKGLSYGGRCRGFSLAELMVTVAVLGLLAAIGLPVYQGYAAEARLGMMQSSIRALAMMQADRMSDLGAFVEGEWTPDGLQSLGERSRLGWAPRDGSLVAYRVECVIPSARVGECARDSNGDGNLSDPSGYIVTATHPDEPAAPLVVRYDGGNNRL